MALFLLFESASGYALLEVTAQDEIAAGTEAVQAAAADLARFGKVVKLSAFKPFTQAAHALEQINAVSESQARGCACMRSPPGLGGGRGGGAREGGQGAGAQHADGRGWGGDARAAMGTPPLALAAALAPHSCAPTLPPTPLHKHPQMTEDLKNFLTTNLPKVKKDGKAKFSLGVGEAKLGSAIQVWRAGASGVGSRPAWWRGPVPRTMHGTCSKGMRRRLQARERGGSHSGECSARLTLPARSPSACCCCCTRRRRPTSPARSTPRSPSCSAAFARTLPREQRGEGWRLAAGARVVHPSPSPPHLPGGGTRCTSACLPARPLLAPALQVHQGPG